MAMGKVVIASDIGGHRELMTNSKTGILFPAGDETALSEAIVSVLNNPDMATRLREEGKKQVMENKTWGKTTSAYKEIYSPLSVGAHNKRTVLRVGSE